MASAVVGVAAWAVAPAGQGVEKSGDQQCGGMSCRLVVVEPGAGPDVMVEPVQGETLAVAGPAEDTFDSCVGSWKGPPGRPPAHRRRDCGTAIAV